MHAIVLKFGEFTLDIDRQRLQRRGFDVKLEGLPLRLLLLLVEQRGHIVSRRTIEEELWGRDVFVDVEQGINTAIRKIRRVLCDHPEKPRYLQTIVGRGYRFIAVEVAEDETGSPNASTLKPAAGSVTVTLEQLGEAILSAAALESVFPHLSRFDVYAQRSDDKGTTR